MTASGNELRDAARLARESVVVGRAVTLGRWIGTGRRPVTAGQVLRKADVPAAGAALGVDVPSRLRTMADIGALHRPWCVAVATGLLQIGGGWVTGGPALEGWPPYDADLLTGWLTGLRAACAAESYPQDEDSVRLLAMALLTVLGQDQVPRADALWGPVNAALHDLCDRYDKPPGFSDEEQQHHVAWGWLAGRDPAQAAREILAAAEGMSPLLRSVAVRVVERLGEDALPAWREMKSSPHVGPHARAELAAWNQGPEPGDTDWDWLAVEAASAALQDQGADEALNRVWEGMPGADLDAFLAAVQGTGHPEAAALARAVAEFAASGAPLSIEQVAELKVANSCPAPDLAAGPAAGRHHPGRSAPGHPGAVRLGRRPPAPVPAGQEAVHRPVHGPGADQGRTGSPDPRRPDTRREDRLHLRLRSRLGTRDHAGADDPARPRPGLPRLRAVARRLPGGVLVRGRP
jgi:hypothetical protein